MAKRKQPAKPAFNMTDALDLVMAIPEIKEAYTRADVELALDDRGWLVSGKTTAELDPQTRQIMVTKARLYWLRDPLAKQAVRLWTDYALSSGISYSCEDKDVQSQLDAFMKDRRNKRFTNSEGQRKSSKRVLIDGEMFFAIFTDQQDNKILRTIDCLQIVDIITDPDDDEHILCYKRETKAGKVLYYADWTASDEDKALAEKQKDQAGKGNIKLEDNVVIRHVPFDSLQKRGNSMLGAGLDWSREHRRFMEARVAITQALAKFAFKGNVKGGQKLINQIQSQLASTLTRTGPSNVEQNPQNAPGGTWLQNAGIDLNAMPRSTGAGDATADGNQLKLMMCAATGIMLHYFGDPSTGNLATATAMELPMLKMFQSYQQFWIDVYRDIFSIVLDEDPDEEPADIDIDLPPILADDLQKLAQFVTSMASVFPELKVPEVLRMCLISLGVNNVPEVMKSIAARRVEIDAKNAAMLAAAVANAKNNPVVDPANPVNPGAAVLPHTDNNYESAVLALDRLSKVMQEVFA